MATPLALDFVTSAANVAQLPDSPAEIAFVGRSNVGKSSLINALANRKALARVSKTPGRTQLLNLFVLPNGATVVDLPGYGFANAPKAVRNQWGAMIHNYLLQREALRCVMVLVDGEIGPTKLDIEMLEWLSDNQLRVAIVATKHDKVKASVRQKRKKELAEKCGVEGNAISWVSAAKNVGIVELRATVRELLAVAN